MKNTAFWSHWKRDTAMTMLTVMRAEKHGFESRDSSLERFEKAWFNTTLKCTLNGEKVEELNRIEHLSHPAYNLDLSPSNYRHCCFFFNGCCKF